MKNKIRLNLEISPKTSNEMKKLKEQTDAASNSEVVRRAICLYSLILSSHFEGGKTFIVNEGGESEILALF